MSCELKDRDRRMDEFLLGEMSTEEADAFEIHAFSCPECRAELRMREQMVDALKQQSQTRSTVVASQRPKKGVETLFNTRKPWIYAGAAVAMLVLAVLIIRDPAGDPSVVDAKNFAESPYLESILTQTFQSSDIAVSVESPKIGDNLTGEIVFEWRATQDGEDFSGVLDLKILNNRESLVHSATVQRQRYMLQNRLDPGLYYWTLEDQGQMLYLGKFLVSQPKK